MKKHLLSVFFIVFCLQFVYGQALIKKRNNTLPIIAGHLAVDQFDSIPDSILPELAQIKIMFRHASVGTTIDNGLNCLQGTRSNPAICKTFPPYKYDRRNWQFQPRGNSGWYGKIADFMNETRKQLDSHEIFSFKYCYLDGLDELAEPCGKPFNDNNVAKAWKSLKDSMEFLENQYPDKLFIWWTIPLTQPGQHCTDTLNKLIRQYVSENHKILFDIADIQCHDSNKTRILNPSGWEMAYSGWCGEKPPGPSCHPNWTGSIMLAKAFWRLVASIYGWNDTSAHTQVNHINPDVNYQVYPNPVTQKLFMRLLLSNPEKISITMWSTTGKLLKTYQKNDYLNAGEYCFTADLSELENGIYLLKIQTLSEDKILKILKISP